MSRLRLFKTEARYNAVANRLDFPTVSWIQDIDEMRYVLDKNPIQPDDDEEIDLGFDYVDLGLPSGTLWATKNVGAANVTDYGLFFAWGETTGYSDSQIPSERVFDDSDYELLDGNGNATKYNENDALLTLEATDDAASVQMNNYWHLPTDAQVDELLDGNNTTYEFVNSYNDITIDGIVFTSLTNGNELFFPAAGGRLKGAKEMEGEIAMCWSNSLGLKDYYNALMFGGDSNGSNRTYSDRTVGLTVRGVVDGPTYTISITDTGELSNVPKDVYYSVNSGDWAVFSTKEGNTYPYEISVGKGGTVNIEIEDENYNAISVTLGETDITSDVLSVEQSKYVIYMINLENITDNITIDIGSTSQLYSGN